jgi:hypothetical protein
MPFCVFKLVTGLIALDSAAAPVGYALVALGSIDLVLNTLNLFALLVLRRRISGVCLADVLLRDGLGLAVDVFLSFGLVAIAIGAGLLSDAPAWTLPIWNIAVVLNVLGAGVGRLLEAMRHRRSRQREAPATG